MPSYPETPPSTVQIIPDYPKTPDESDDKSNSPTATLERPFKPRSSRARRPRASSSSSLPFSGRFATPPHHPRQQISQPIASNRIQRRRPAVSGHQRAESFEHYLSSARRLTRRNPSNDEMTTLGFANGLLPRRGQALAPTSGGMLRDSPPLSRHQHIEQLEQRVENLQMVSQGESEGPRWSGPRRGVAFSTRATQISTSRRTCEEPEDDASPFVPVCHWSDESD
ncbi:uncharacterized protein FPRO_12513 [Fusarium proliferatum ET1]|uniref:Uncharacterized protein n=1 Tax=Fusarium proliferatum (strain ET1) TaxID=1227346 RepID=A0A1L7W929_FUSPR|nr:uncharacterized protein FPRO_12513 [Fusarium proliferatum ET1]CZR49076.1 uncharacterized protein FPRO_12513 [Fusarium proliferatum ET1]